MIRQTGCSCRTRTWAALIDRLSHIYTGEVAPLYVLRYGLHEKHTGYRVDPIAIASIFGLLTMEELDRRLDGKLDSVLFSHYVAISTA